MAQLRASAAYDADVAAQAKQRVIAMQAELSALRSQQPASPSPAPAPASNGGALARRFLAQQREALASDAARWKTSEQAVNQSVQGLLTLSRAVPSHFDDVNALLLALQKVLQAGRQAVKDREALLAEAEASLPSD